MALESQNTQADMVTLSVIDRVVGDNVEHPNTRREAITHLKRNVRRDLEWLLNTRQNPDAVGKEFPELERSVFNYGLPDFTNMSVLNNRERNTLLRALGDCIAYFERLPPLSALHAVASDATRTICNCRSGGMAKALPT